MAVTHKKNLYILPTPTIPITFYEQYSKLNKSNKRYLELQNFANHYISQIVLENNLLPPVFKDIDLSPYAISIYFVRETILEMYEVDVFETLGDVIDYVSSNQFWASRSLSPLSMISPSKNRIIRYFELQFQIEQNWRTQE